MPTTVETCPGPRNPSSCRSGESRIAFIGGMIVTWLQKHEEVAHALRPLHACSVSAVDGAVVSKPMA